MMKRAVVATWLPAKVAKGIGMSHPLLRRTITTLTALAERHEDGDRVDAIVSATLATLIYAVEEGRTDSLWAQLSPIWTQWGVEAGERARATLAPALSDVDASERSEASE